MNFKPEVTTYRSKPANAAVAILVVIAATALSFSAHASKRPLFDDTTPLDAVLTVPLSQAYGQKRKDVRPYLDGTLSYKGENGVITRVPLKVKTRGNFRRANCSLPPLRLNFPKKLVSKTLFKGQDKLKLVGPCKFGGAYKDLIGLELLAYQVYQTVSEFSLKTRQMNLSYVDISKKRKPRTSTAFVIEDIEDLAKRRKLKYISPEKANRDTMDLDETALLEIFALFIANNDYSTLTGLAGTKCCHNVRLLSPKDGNGKVIPVPYDFDMSGLVNAPYAAPPGTIPIKNVRKRYFNGWCKEDTHFRNAVDRFKQKKPDIMALVENSTTISDSLKKKTTAYFEQFYTMMDSPKRYQKEITGRCRGRTVSD